MSSLRSHVQAKKKIVYAFGRRAKSVLLQPDKLKLKWAQVPQDAAQKIIEDFTKTLQPHKLWVRQKQSREEWRERVKRTKLEKKEKRGKLTEKEKDELQKMGKVVRRVDEAAAEKAKERQHVRCQLAIGINAVTQRLEKDELSLVLVDPAFPQLTNHLLPLVVTRGCACAALDKFSLKTSFLLGCTQLNALGFKKAAGDGMFGELVSRLSGLCSPPHCPTLPQGRLIQDATSPVTSSPHEGGEGKQEEVEDGEKVVKKEESAVVPGDFLTRDYSHLFIKRGNKEKKKRALEADFIAFGSGSGDDSPDIDSCEEDKTGSDPAHPPSQGPGAKKRKTGPHSLVQYEKPKVALFNKNENREFQKKKHGRYLAT